MSSEYYQPPASHDNHIRSMVIALSAFFGVLVMLVITVIIFAPQLAKHVPFAAEKQFVRPYEALAERFLTTEPSEDEQEIERYLQTLVDELAVTMSLPSDFDVTVHYVSSDVPNAFVMLGGHLFVFSGLLESIPDENSLAMVLSHELAHIHHRDPVVAMGRGVALAMLYAFFTGDYSAGVDVASVTGEIGLSMFSREQESSADKAALINLNKHYSHVAGYDTFFAAMLERETEEPEANEVLDWLASHPKTSERIQVLDTLIEEKEFTVGEAADLPDSVIEALNGQAGKQ